MNESQQQPQQRQEIASEIYRLFCGDFAGISIAEAKACLDEAKLMLELKTIVGSHPNIQEVTVEIDKKKLAKAEKKANHIESLLKEVKQIIDSLCQD